MDIKLIREDIKRVISYIEKELRGNVKSIINTKTEVLKIQLKKFDDRDHEMITFEREYTFEEFGKIENPMFIGQRFIYDYRQTMKKRERERK